METEERQPNNGSAAETTENTQEQTPDPAKKPARKGAACKAWFRARKDRVVLLVLASVALPLLFFISTPLDIFSHNRAEFVFVWADFMPQCIGAAVGLTVLVAGVLLVLPYRAFRVTAFVLLWLAFMLFLQGTFLNGSMTMLSGDVDEGSQVITARSAAVMALDLLLWIATLGVTVFFALRKDKKGYVRIAAYIAGALVVATQLITILSISITNSEVYLSQRRKEEKYGKYYALTGKGVTDIASERNVYYILVDRFDARYAESALAEYLHIYDALDGFTWFTDATSVYAHTYPSVPCMLTDRTYDPEKYRDEFLGEAYLGDDTPLSMLSRAGYKVNLYTQAYYCYKYNGKSLPDYVENFSSGTYKAEQKTELFGRMLLLGGFRTIPQYFKTLGQRGGNVDSGMCNRCVSFRGDDGFAAHDSNNRNLYYGAKKTGFKDAETEKRFTFLHMEGCHNIWYDPDFNPVPESKRTNINYSVVTSFKIIEQFIAALKARGLYEDATIVITGDHPGAPNRRGPLDTYCRTALFVKPRGAAGTAVVRSTAQVSHDDVWPTIFKSEGIDDENYDARKSVFEVAEDEVRTRRFINHTYMRGNLSQYYYEIEGCAGDFANWKLDESRCKHYKRHIMD